MQPYILHQSKGEYLRVMDNEAFKRSSHLVWILVVFLMSIPVAFIWLTVDGGILQSNWDELKFAILIDGGLLLSFAYLCSSPIIQLRTKYTDNGIEQPSIFGSKFLHWQDIREIRNITTGNIILVSSNTKININPNLFLDPLKLLSEIRSRVPESAYPSDAQINQEIINGKRDGAKRSAIGAYIFVILIFVIGTNVVAKIIFSLIILGYALYETRKWIKYGRKHT